MGRRYSGVGAAVVGTDKTILTLISTTAVRPELYDLTVGSSATPADQATLFYVQRFTAVGTEGSGYTPVALEPADPAAVSDYGVGAFSVEPTYTASTILLQIPLNQRATYRWVAAPGSGLRAPASANNGLGIKSSAGTGTASHGVSALHEE